MGGGDLAGAGVMVGCLGGGAGAETSKRSPMLVVAAGGLLVTELNDGGEAAAVEKSPKSPPKLSFLAVVMGSEGGEVGFGGGAGLASKKLPPLNADDLLNEAFLVCPAGDVKPENGGGFC